MQQYAEAGNSGDKIRSDCYIKISPADSGGIQILLKSKVETLYGKQIKEQITSDLQKLGIVNASVEMEDSGALPFVISARIEAAVAALTGEKHSLVFPVIDENRYHTEKSRFRISRLYLPGNSPGMMLNAGIHQPDGIILDLEDSVAPAKKKEASILVRNALACVNFYGAERMVRINQLPAGLDDLEMLIPAFVNLVLLPKCESPDQVIRVTEKIRELQKQHNQDHHIWLMPIIESALGVEYAYEIAKASDTVVAMAIGLEDFTADLGVQRTAEGSESLYARQRIVNACKAAGIQAIDSVFSDVADMEGLLENVKRSKALGFEGMGCIHPRQVPVIREGFAPAPGEIEKASAIVEAYNLAKERGEGVISIGTKMIDAPVVKRAERTIQLAVNLGLIN